MGSANVQVADVDGDRDLDVVLAKGRHTPLHNRIFLNDGKGHFGSTMNFQGNLTARIPRPLLILTETEISILLSATTFLTPTASISTPETGASHKQDSLASPIGRHATCPWST